MRCNTPFLLYTVVQSTEIKRRVGALRFLSFSIADIFKINFFGGGNASKENAGFCC